MARVTSLPKVPDYVRFTPAPISPSENALPFGYGSLEVGWTRPTETSYRLAVPNHNSLGCRRKRELSNANRSYWNWLRRIGQRYLFC